MNDDLISIIVPVYNVEKYLGKCLDSIIKQTYKVLEIILVDDGSTDSSGKICDDYERKDERIKVIHKSNNGVSSARNAGIDLCNGEYISFVDADDWIEDNFIEKLYKIAKEEKADIVQSGYYRITGINEQQTVSNQQDDCLNLYNKTEIKNKNISNKRRIDINVKKEAINSDKTIKIYDNKKYLEMVLNPQTGCGFCHMKLINKKIIKDVRFPEDIVVGEDALFNEKISQNFCKFILCCLPLYNYRINENSVVKKFDTEYANKYLTSMKKNREYIFQNYCTNKIILQNYYNFVAYHILLILVNYCYNPKNQINNLQRKNLVKEICNNEIFAEGIKKSNYSYISFTRKIALFAIKHKLYFVIRKICEFRQKQNRK